MNIEIQEKISDKDLQDPLIKKAYEYADKAHAGQFRLHGAEYICHPLGVYNFLKLFTEDKDLLASALLHDVIEDCNILRPELLLDFNQRIVDIVDALSKKPGETTPNYFRTLKDAPVEIRLVKVCDRYNNLSQIRLTNHKFFIQRTIRETKKYIYPLCQGLPELFLKLKSLVDSLVVEFNFTDLLPSVKNAKIIGLVGGIACGKSKILKYLKDKEYRVIDSNDCWEQFYHPGSEEYDQLIDAFGRYFLKEDESFDRRKLRNHVFGDMEMLDQYSTIIHPALDQNIWDSINSFHHVKDNLIFYTSSILLRSIESRCMDYLVFVRCSPKVQVTRLMERDAISRTQAEKIIKCQYNLDRIIDNCDFLLKNDGDFSDTLTSFKQIILNIQTFNLLKSS